MPGAVDTAFLTALVAVAAALLFWARSRFASDPDTVVDAIEAVLPQTQCAQCGYPGCRPYAEAVARGAAIDLCPPGGRDTELALANLLGRSPGGQLADVPAVRARIDEARCVGCFLCVEACPVDAIVGAPRFVHTVLEERCTGCELCLPPCPVDCIELIPLTTPEPVPEPLPGGACIRCGGCDPVCPEHLPVAELWQRSRGADLDRARRIGLDRCIECGLCNAQCPSGIDLVGTFRAARRHVDDARRAQAAATLARQHVEERRARLERERRQASDRRRQRLAAFKTSRAR
ncbi:MAG: RnfABCDGE type electron transport complex subunit B [Gammaproteobacteria bacterium]